MALVSYSSPREKPRLKLARDYPEVVEHLQIGVTQVASLGDVTFAAASRGFGAKPILRPKNQNGEPDYSSLIVVRRESPISTVTQLKGKSGTYERGASGE